jgi:hypothetical protein
MQHVENDDKRKNKFKKVKKLSLLQGNLGM